MRVREFDFNFEEEDVLNYARTKTITRIINSVSLLFPVGERHFCEAVRHYKPMIHDEVLQRDISTFIRQEANHSRAHRQLNVRLQEQTGVDVYKQELQALDRLNKYAETPQEKLLVTVCLEEYTAFLGWMLPKVNKLILKRNEPSRMLAKHAKEEEEHAHVAKEVLNRYAPVSKLSFLKYMAITGKELVAQTYVNYKAIKKAENERGIR